MKRLVNAKQVSVVTRVGQQVKHFSRGFTLIELMVTVAVIAILAGIGVFGYASVQQDARDSSRNAKATTIAEALEKYYEEHGEYPSVAALADRPIGDVRQKLSLNSDDILVFPRANSSTIASITSGTPSTSAVAYDGATINSDDSGQCESDVSGYCDSFELKYEEEATGETKVIVSRNQGVASLDPGEALASAPTVLAEADDRELTITATGVTCENGDVQYKIRYGTSSSALPDWSTIAWSSATEKVVDGEYDTTYYFQAIARCVVGGDGQAQSSPSAIDSYKLEAPTPGAASVTATPISSTQIRVSWQSVAGADSYQVRWVVGSGNPTNLLSGCSMSPCTISGLSPSTLHRVSVTSVSSEFGLGDPGYAQATTLSALIAPPAPAVSMSPSATTGTHNSVTWSWGAVSAANCTSRGATLQYQYNYQTSASQTGSWVNFGTNRSVVATTSAQGAWYRVHARAYCARGSEVVYSGSTSARYTRDITSTVKARDGRAYVEKANSTTMNGVGVVRDYKGSCASGLVTQIRGRTTYTTNKSETPTAEENWGPWNAWGTFSGKYTNKQPNIKNDTKTELAFMMRCYRADAGNGGVNEYSDLFGNLFITQNRNTGNNKKGMWDKRCGGHTAWPTAMTSQWCTPSVGNIPE